ncbi:hypothetical protein QTP88_022301 [Uroleucon formosanum]
MRRKRRRRGGGCTPRHIRVRFWSLSLSPLFRTTYHSLTPASVFINGRTLLLHFDNRIQRRFRPAQVSAIYNTITKENRDNQQHIPHGPKRGHLRLLTNEDCNTININLRFRRPLNVRKNACKIDTASTITELMRLNYREKNDNNDRR